MHEEIIICDICGEAAIYKAFGGPVLRKASKYGHDIPEAENYTYRCKKHQDFPVPVFGKLWIWEYINRF